MIDLVALPIPFGKYWRGASPAFGLPRATPPAWAASPSGARHPPRACLPRLQGGQAAPRHQALCDADRERRARPSWPDRPLGDGDHLSCDHLAHGEARHDRPRAEPVSDHGHVRRGAGRHAGLLLRPTSCFWWTMTTMPTGATGSLPAHYPSSADLRRRRHDGRHHDASESRGKIAPRNCSAPTLRRWSRCSRRTTRRPSRRAERDDGRRVGSSASPSGEFIVAKKLAGPEASITFVPTGRGRARPPPRASPRSTCSSPAHAPRTTVSPRTRVRPSRRGPWRGRLVAGQMHCGSSKKWGSPADSARRVFSGWRSG